MANEKLVLTFEPNITVAGQILILEAVDFIYSVAVLKDVGLRNDRPPDWHLYITTLPGKLLAPAWVLRVHSAHSSAVTEVVEGVDRGVQLLKKLLRMLRELQAVGPAQIKLRIVREELLPVIEHLRTLGAPEEQINEMISKVLLYADGVLTELMKQNKLKLQ
ncbi:MAG: hypothetical protein FVQ84_21445 [Planctomycetes bacterium]|nr:hypothetical protein [Planctomycetota bacterium]